MSNNPWLKKNPFMSMWLSAANSTANKARGQIEAGVKRQAHAVAAQATQEIFNFWTGASAVKVSKPAAKPAVKGRTKKR